jgi:hypothetical protein
MLRGFNSRISGLLGKYLGRVDFVDFAWDLLPVISLSLILTEEWVYRLSGS